MKKSFLSILALSVLLPAICACNNNSPSSSGQSSSPTTSSGTSSSSIDPHSKLTDVELGTLLKTTPYAINGIETEGKIGLSNPSQVGVIQNTTRVYTEIPDSQYVSTNIIVYDSITLEDVKAFFPTETELNDTTKLKTCIAKAKSLSDGTQHIKIKLPARQLDIKASDNKDDKVMVIDGIDNLAIIGSNTTFNIIYKDLVYNGWMSITNCKNFAILGCNVDSEIGSTLVGKITSMDTEACTSTIAVDKEFNPLVEELKKTNHKLMEYLEYNYQTKIPLMGGNFVDRGDFSKYEITGTAEEGYVIKVTFNKAIKRSRNQSYVSLAFSEYDNASVNINTCENVIFEDVNIYHAPGMGIVGTKVKDLYLDRTNICLKEGTNDLLTCTADGMHFVSCHGKVEITNCIVENTHDDALNIKHGYWYSASDFNNSGSTYTCKIDCSTEVEAPKVGDKLAIYEQDTFVGHNPTSGAYNITAVAKAASGYTVTVDKRFSNYGTWKTCKATLINDTPEFLYKNNIVRNKRNRGILVQVPNAVVENNTFQNIGHGSIQAASALDIFNEATIPQGITIKNNKFVDNIFLTPDPLIGDISVFAIAADASVAPQGTVTGAKLENNYFTGNGNAATSFRGAGSATIQDCFFYECCKNTEASNKQLNTLVNAYNCSAMTVGGSYSYYSLGKGMSGIYLQGLTKETDFTLAENTNIDFYHSTDVGPDVDVTAATGTITYDGDLSEWATIGATQIDLIAASEATGAEVDMQAISDHFKVKSAYITHTSEGIAMAFDVFDNLKKVDPQAAYWTGDCIEILASAITNMPSADMAVYKDQGAVLQIAFAPDWSTTNYCTIAKARSNSSYLGKENNVKVGMSSTTDGYKVEFCLPYTVFPEFKTAVDAGQRICIATVIADASRKESIGIERVQIGNVPHFVETYKTMTERMPRYLFK